MSPACTSVNTTASYNSANPNGTKTAALGKHPSCRPSTSRHMPSSTASPTPPSWTPSWSTPSPSCPPTPPASSNGKANWYVSTTYPSPTAAKPHSPSTNPMSTKASSMPKAQASTFAPPDTPIFGIRLFPKATAMSLPYSRTTVPAVGSSYSTTTKAA
ncbi:unknown [Prevotella sp. CAG:873]|nr:unknown [Prevotella sp. CAG:873]